MSIADFELTVSHGENVTIVTLRGNGGMRAADALATGLLPVIASRPAHVMLDLSGLTFISSLVIGQLVTLNRGLAAHGGRVTIAAPQEDVMLALKHARLDQAFEIIAAPSRIATG